MSIQDAKKYFGLPDNCPVVEMVIDQLPLCELLIDVSEAA